VEAKAGLAETRAALASGVSFEPQAADELMLIAGALARPAPELKVLPLERDAILRYCLPKAA